MNRILLLILFFVPFFTNAQVVNDAKLWTAITLNKKVNDFEFSFSQELRRNENFSHTDKAFFELGGEYNLQNLDGLSINAGYRFSRENDYETSNYDLNQRVDFGLNYKHKFDKIQIDFKTKIQVEKAPANENNSTYSRNKITAKYKLNSDLDPFISYEFYYQFNDEHIINRTRISLGTRYEINKHNSLKVFYLFENKFNVKNLQHNHIWGIGYSHDL
jgi:long-subunit fatty acid transport protein